MEAPLEHLEETLRRRGRQGFAIDDWRPAVQGAVGHVVGLRDADGTGYVAKVFGPAAGRRAATEATALRLAGAARRPARGATDVPVPAVVLDGPLPGGGSFILMTRLPGVRWADRRAGLDADQDEHLLREVAEVLHRLHAVAGDRFGGLLPGDPAWSTAWERVSATVDERVAEFLAHGGPPELADRVRALVLRHRGLFGPQVRPVLCHHDLNGGNVLVAAAGAPRVTGVVDLERASWDDPVADVALTVLHLWHHGAAGIDVLLDAYGLGDRDARLRLDVHVVLLAVAERSWVVQDRPAGWARSAAALDELILRST